jgi:hypothetical protein
MRDWAVCTIGTTARLEIDRFEKACAFEPYGSEYRLIPTIRRDLAAAKTATPGGWPHLRIGNLWSEHFPGTFCIVANDSLRQALYKKKREWGLGRVAQGRRLARRNGEMRSIHFGIKGYFQDSNPRRRNAGSPGR